MTYKKISKLKMQVALLYVAAWCQLGLMALALMVSDIKLPKLFWTSSLIINMAAIAWSRPYQIMDTLIDAYVFEEGLKELHKIRSKKNV